MRNSILILLLVMSFFGFSQKIKVKGTSVLIDKVESFKIREDKVSRKCYIVSNLKGEDIFYLKSSFYNDPSTVKPTTPGHYSSGDVYYFEVLSADLEKIYFENRMTACMMGCDITENVLLQLFNGEVVNTDGSINEDKLNLLSKKIGFEFSRKRDELNKSNPNTIIINNQQPRSGININLGR